MDTNIIVVLSCGNVCLTRGQTLTHGGNDKTPEKSRHITSLDEKESKQCLSKHKTLAYGWC